MKLSFNINKYLLMWYLLYQPSISDEMHKLKQKLWINHKKEYSSLYTEKDIILKDLEDYIPDDDTVFNLLETNDIFKKVKSETNKYRLSLLEIWDLNKKNYLKELNSILKLNMKDEYKLYIVHPNLNIVDICPNHNIVIVGKKITTRDKDNFLTYLFYKILKKIFSNLKLEDRELIGVILELITINELYTRESHESKYNYGKKDTVELKKKIYPYWLMYLGVKEEKFEEYMIRDNIFFNKELYKYDEALAGYDIYGFITYCMRFKKRIVSVKSITVEEIEVI